ncbi:MAG: choice-of-anchor Q domain-containing protein [Planctomycetota bacterium]
MLRNHKSRTRPGRAAAALNRSPRCEQLEDRRVLAAIVVDTTLDVVDLADGVTSLREAIFAANTVPGHQEIAFDFGFNGPATILLTEGELSVTDSVTITGDGPELLTIDASGNDPTPDEDNGDGSRVFAVSNFSLDDVFEATLRGLTLTGGDSDRHGGAILNVEDLTLEDTVVTGNHARLFGGGIYSGGVPRGPSYISLTIRDSVISANHNDGDGGGGLAAHQLLIERSEITANRTSGFGGGLWIRSTATILESTISSNEAENQGGGFAVTGMATIVDSHINDNTAHGLGGGVWLLGTADIIDSNVKGNVSLDSSGGGIALSSGRRGASLLSIKGSALSNNIASDNGGGIYSEGSRFTIESSTITSNTSGGSGGGILLDASSGRAVIADSTIASNVATNAGGGLYVDHRSYGSETTVLNSTVSGNSAAFGGGIFLEGRDDSPLEIQNSTIAYNRATTTFTSGGGGISVDRGVAKLNDSIVSNNRSGGTINDLGITDSTNSLAFEASYSLIGAIALETPAILNNTLLGFDPLLGPLEDNGGPTPTHALLPGSPAIDAGDPSAVAGMDEVPEFDQRGPGFARVAGAAIDIGAFEVQTQPPGMSAIVDDTDGDGDNDIADLLAAQRGVVAATPTVEQSVALSTASAVEEDSGPIVVSTNVDGVDIEDDFVSLREAIFAANIVSGHQEIVFRFQNPLVDPVTFLLTEGELRISDSLTITGPGGGVAFDRRIGERPDAGLDLRRRGRHERRRRHQCSSVRKVFE